MLIGICGGICAGKHAVADFLINEHGFIPLSLNKTPNGELQAVQRLSLDGTYGSTNAHSFNTLTGLVEFVTRRWQEKWVMTDIWDASKLDTLMRKPFFLLISVDAPLMVRWRRYRARCDAQGYSPPNLERFVSHNDRHLYHPDNGLAHLIDRAQLRLLNSSTSLEDFHIALKDLNLTEDSRLRPSWDQYFMQLASLAAQRSNCMKRRVGCVIVRDKRVISTGYNGTPRGITNCNEGGCPRCNNGASEGAALSTCLCIHAEENALLEAGRERVREGASLYCDTCPCLTCSIKIAQVGITEVVYNQGYYMDDQIANMFKQAGIKLRQFSPPTNGLVDL